MSVAYQMKCELTSAFDVRFRINNTILKHQLGRRPSATHAHEAKFNFATDRLIVGNEEMKM